MNMTAATATPSGSPPVPNGGSLIVDIRLPRRLVIVVALAAIADWLFYGHPVGISVVIALLALMLGAALANPLHVSRRDLPLTALVLVAALLPFVVEPSPLALIFAALGTAYVVVATTSRTKIGCIDRLTDAALLWFDACWRVLADLSGIAAWSSERDIARQVGRAALSWVLPLALGAVFLLLFSSANPLIERWLEAVDLRSPAGQISWTRILFWLLAAALVWPFVFLRLRCARKKQTLREKIEADFRAARLEAAIVDPPSELFGKAAILRSLVLFNLMFAVQTVLDATYLWGGVALPDGLTYAAYAHRGAYPLIVTALLAAGFVLAATRRGSEAARSPLVRALVYLWTAQNVLLVVSSILRLDLYVEVYSLTYWRIAAFVWMLLVAIGLILIVTRIALNRSNAWLIGANMVSLAVTLYVCCFFNFPRMIAIYNVEHSAGLGLPVLDLNYLYSLGPQAIPGLDLFAMRRNDFRRNDVIAMRETLALQHRQRMSDWRAWSVRDWQLARYLHATPDAIPR